MADLSQLIHGTKPKVAPFVETDPNEMLKKLLNGEITDWPEIQQLSKLFQNQQFEQMGFDLPGLLSLGGADAKTLLEQAGTMEKGQIPPDVAQQVMRSAAFQSLGAGTMGGPMGSALAARNLGLSSLDVMKQGADLATSGGNAAQRWASIAQGTMLPQSAYLYSPQWYTAFMAQQAAAKRDVKQQKFNIAAQPDPAWADRAKLAGSILGAYAAGPSGAQAGNSMNTASAEQVPAGGAGGLWAQLTGQPYDMMGSNTGAVTTEQNNATPFLTNPDGSLYYPPPPNQFNSTAPSSFNPVTPPGGAYVPTSNQSDTTSIPPWMY